MPAKKGNKNALKHGIYSKFIRIIDDKEMADMKADQNIDELANARVMLADATNRRENAPDDKERIGWDYACRHWTEIIGTLTNQNKVTGQQEIQIFESLFEAVRAANDKQNWKR
jgi:hypothetical protein